MGVLERKIVARWLASMVKTARRARKERKLYIFDFDGTLHRSPPPPKGPPGQESWWSDPSSLEPPHVPREMDPSMWRPETVDAMRDAMKEEDAYVVVMTGRHESLKDRIAELLDEAGLRPDELITNPEIGGTQRYKRDEMLYLLRQFPNVREVEFWEDRPDDLKTYQKAAEKAGVGFTPREVRDYSQETPPYVGVFLDADSRRKLLEKFPPKHGSIRADHVTLKFKPSDEEMQRLLESRRLGEQVKLKVVGYSEDESGQAVVVELPKGLRMDDRTPHVTLSVADGVPAVYSNELLDRGYTPLAEPVEIEGYLDGGPSPQRSHGDRKVREKRPRERGEPPSSEAWERFLGEKTRNPDYGKPGHSREYVQRRTLYQRGGTGRDQVMREWARQGA